MNAMDKPAVVAPITPADREKAKELCAKATNGWHIRERPKGQAGPPLIVDAADATVSVVGHGNDAKAKAIADFIAFSRTAIPSYEARVVELEAALAHEKEIGAGLVLDLEREEARTEAAEARATALLEALRPIIDKMPDWFWDIANPNEHRAFLGVTLGDFRAARAAIKDFGDLPC